MYLPFSSPPKSILFPHLLSGRLNYGCFCLVPPSQNASLNIFVFDRLRSCILGGLALIEIYLTSLSRRSGLLLRQIQRAFFYHRQWVTKTIREHYNLIELGFVSVIWVFFFQRVLFVSGTVTKMVSH